MWRNYMTVGWRALVRDRTYAFINVFGLAIGLAACLILLLYGRYEASYDAGLPDADRVYQVQTIPTSDSIGARQPQQAAHGVLSEALPRAFPQIEAAARMDGERLVFLVGGEARFVETMVSDPNLFSVLQVPFLRGDPATALRGTEALVLSRTQAMTLFGSIDVIGRTITQIRRGERYARRVTGVFEDLPRNSNLDIGAVAPITDEARENCSWGCVNGYVFLKLRPGASAADINNGLAAFERTIPPRNVGNQRISEGDLYDWRLVNIRDVHLSGAEEGPETRPVSDRRTIATFAIVAILILAMATMNFVNLATARASKRAREVALRKTLGARRSQLIGQFLGESLLIAGTATLIALAFAELSLPYFSAYLGVELALTYVGSGGLLPAILGLWIAVGLIGGLYPAFYLSRYQPGEILRANKASAEPTGSGRLRNILVVAQFAVSIGLIICTIVVYHQTAFAQRSELGFERSGLLQVDNLNRAAVVPQVEAMMREMARVPGVESIAATTIAAASGTTLTASVQMPGRPAETIGFYAASPDFFRTMGVRLLAGRTLSRRYANDYGQLAIDTPEATLASQRAVASRGVNIVVNRAAAERLGLGGPDEALGRQLRVQMYGEEIGLVPATVVGVVEDSRFRSARTPIEPMIFYDNGIYRQFVIRYRATAPDEVRRAVGDVWRRFAPEMPFEGEFAEDQLAEVYRQDVARGRTFAGFALLAVLIAGLGLFGLAAFTAERRTKEIGIRKVFGASTRDIVQLLVWQFTRPVILANLIAWPVAWWVMRDWLNGFDSRIDLTPAPFVVAGFLAFLIALGTITGHALRVARTNPIHALRYE